MISCVVTLRQVTGGLDEFKKPTKTFTDRKVYAVKKSVGSAEFYQAAATGLKPELVFSVRGYKGEEYLLYRDVQYRIIRTYEKGDSTMLTCTSLLTESEYTK